MRFTFTEDQLLFQTSVRNLLTKECTPQHVRKLWDTETGRSPEMWSKLADIGLLGLLVPEGHGGMGMDEVDLVLPLEETGRAALPEPVLETAAIGVPLLASQGSKKLQERWLPEVASGKAILTVGHSINPCVCDAHVADLLLLQHGEDEIHAVPRDRAVLQRQPCSDASRRLFSVRWTPGPDTCVAKGKEGRCLLDQMLDRGALASAAQQLGIAQQLVDMAVQYGTERHQFGKPIGSFQAIKHMLANVQVRIEFARPVVYRAAFALARRSEARAVIVSHAKAAASDAAQRAAKAALQVHGAVGYTWEVDLQLWMKRAWALEAAWGNRVWHHARVGATILDGSGAAPTFGYSAPM